MGEYPYPFFDEKGKVICQVCGKSYLVISPPHLKTHNLIYSDYTKRFPQAPLSNKEFVARGKYGKLGKDLLQQSEEPAVEELTTTLEEDPEVEELEEGLKVGKKLDKIQEMKARILDHLRIYFSNIKQDYLIMQYNNCNNFVFEFITDYCDPVLKVVIQFPETFWHNRELFVDPNKNYKLSQYGWKVIEIPSAGPTFEQIDAAIDEVLF
jgi:uncharacterized Zn finger protein (UPF0148 family)